MPMPESSGGTPVTQDFASAEGRFRIGLPGQVVRPGVEGKQDFTWFVFNQGHFLVKYYDYPQAVDTPEVSVRLLKQLGDVIVSKRPTGQLEGDSALTLSGHPGREIRTRDETGIQVDRIYLAGNRMYIVSVFVSKSLDCKLGSAVKVLDTFEITE